MEHIVLETPERRAIYEKDEQRDQLLTKCAQHLSGATGLL
jgi:hypothetical protein